MNDGSERVIPGATVVLSDIRNGLSRTFRTDENGQFSFVLLEPGQYALEVQAAGFATYRQQDIRLEVSQAARLDVALKLASVSESITVSANVHQLETGQAALGAMVDRTAVDELPLNGRNPYQLTSLSSGVATTRVSRSATFTAGQSVLQSTSFSINGGRSQTNEMVVDGMSIVTRAGQPAFRPSPDAIQEFRVLTNAYSAEYGRTGGGALNFSTRAGGNQFRGTLWEFLRNDALDANNFFANQTSAGKQKLRFNQFGGNFGGPMLRDRLFFFVNLEALRLRRASLQQSNVPTLRMKRGDFAELPGAIYTPGPANSRTPFPGNVIPAPLQNPVAQRVLAFYPEPNRPGLFNNYVALSPTDTDERQINARLDYRVTPAQQFFIRYTGNDDTTADGGNFPGSIATSSQQGRLRSEPRNLVLDYVNTLSSTLLLHANAGWSRYTFDRDHASRGFNPGSLGFPSSNTNTSGAGGIFPGFAPMGYAALGPPERMGVRNETNDLFSFSGDMSLIRGSHTLKLGSNFRMNRVYFYAAQNPAGYFTFTRSFTARTPTDVGSGDPMASFLLGLPASGYLGLAPRLALQSNYFALYAQHDWTVTRDLTLNLGLRYESDLPVIERFNRLTTFATSLPFPANPAIVFPGALGIPLRTAPLAGAIHFMGRGGNPRQQSERDLNNLSARVGIAYRWRQRMVIRAGAGIFFSPMPLRAFAISTVGASAESPYLASLDSGVTPTPGVSLSNPFPNGIVLPPGDSLGALTGYGDQTLPVALTDLRNPYVGQWNFSIQRQMPGRLIVELAYAGSTGVGLPSINSDLNQISEAARALGPAVLNTPVRNPFLELPVDQRPPATGILGRPTVSVAQLLRPYPQFGAVRSSAMNDSHSSYHSLQAQVSRRLSESLNFMASYTFSKLIDDTSANLGVYGVQFPNFQNSNNRRLDKSLSTFDSRHRFVAYATYSLPFGRNRRFLHQGGWSDWLLGGWSANAILNAQAGFPLAISATGLSGQSGLAFTDLRPNVLGEAKMTSGPKQDRIRRWFNTDAFAQPPSFGIGNAGRTIPSLRTPGYFGVDLALHKQFQLTERVRFQFRAESFNALNRANLSFPPPGTVAGVWRGTVFGTPDFGRINGAEDARVVQFALKLYF